MKIVQYIPGMQIVNTEHLPRGTGAKYLEVIDHGAGPFIAAQWRRTQPRRLPKGRLLIRFGR